MQVMHSFKCFNANFFVAVGSAGWNRPMGTVAKTIDGGINWAIEWTNYPIFNLSDVCISSASVVTAVANWPVVISLIAQILQIPG